MQLDTVFSFFRLQCDNFTNLPIKNKNTHSALSDRNNRIMQRQRTMINRVLAGKLPFYEKLQRKERLIPMRGLE